MFINYLLSNSTNNFNSHQTNLNNNLSNQTLNDAEHQLISHYCSKLAEFYAKNPQIAAIHHQQQQQQQHSPPNKPQNSDHLFKTKSPKVIKSNLKSFEFNDDQPFSINNNNKNTFTNSKTSNMTPSKTASLNRQHLWSSSNSRSINLNQPHLTNQASSSGSSNNKLFKTSTVLSSSGKKVVLSGVDSTANNNSSSTPTSSTSNNSGSSTSSASSSSSSASSTSSNAEISPLDENKIMFNANVNTAKTRSISECNLKPIHISATNTYNGTLKAYNEMSPNSIRASKTNEERLLKEKREIVAKLEKQNKEILREIKRLKMKQQQQQQHQTVNGNEDDQMMSKLTQLVESSSVCKGATIVDPLVISFNEQQKNKRGFNKKMSGQPGQSGIIANPVLQQNSSLIAELQTLKHRKGQLEDRMNCLESTKDELLAQLETLLKASISSQQKKSQQQPQQQQQHQQQNLTNSPRSLALNSAHLMNALQSNANSNYNISSSPNNPTNQISSTINSLIDSAAATIHNCANLNDQNYLNQSHLMTKSSSQQLTNSSRPLSPSNFFFFLSNTKHKIQKVF